DRACLSAGLSKPSNPKQGGVWSIPGTKGCEETPPEWTPFPAEHFHVHGAIPHRGRSYVALVDAGMVIIDISDVSKPKTISRLDWSPPYGGYAHTTLLLSGRKLVVVVDESVKYDCQEGEKRVWLIDIREEKNPVIVSTCPVPTDDFCKRALRSAPHNVHQHRPTRSQR